MGTARTGRLISATLAVLLVANCGAFAKSPSDSEMLGAIIAFWKARGAVFGGSPDSPYRVATPINARQANDATTTDFMGQKIGTVTVTYTFRANVVFFYTCDTGMGLFSDLLPNRLTTQITQSMVQVRPGNTFACPMTVTYQKTDRGWIVEPVKADGLGFNFIEK